MGFFDQGGQNYDVNMPSGEFESIPAGEYEVDITEVSLENGRNAGSEYLKVRHDIVGPSYQGRVLFQNITVSNQNAKAETIGRQQLNQLQGATGVSALRSAADLQQFVGKRVLARVVIEKDKTQYADKNGKKNRVKGWKAIAGSQMPQVQPQAGIGERVFEEQPNAAPAANGTQSKAPW